MYKSNRQRLYHGIFAYHKVPNTDFYITDLNVLAEELLIDRVPCLPKNSYFSLFTYTTVGDKGRWDEVLPYQSPISAGYQNIRESAVS